MARKTATITNTEVKQAKPKDKEYSLSDGNGLALRVKPNGSKLWVFNYYRLISKKRANLGLGSFPAVSLAEARKRREKARELLAQGIDPKQHREQQQRQIQETNSQTVEQIIEQWFAVKQTSITPNYAVSDEFSMTYAAFSSSD